MFFSNQILALFNYQYLWKETTNVLDFLIRDNQRKVVSKTTTVDWAQPGVVSHSQTSLYLSDKFGWYGSGLNTSKKLLMEY